MLALWIAIGVAFVFIPILAMRDVYGTFFWTEEFRLICRNDRKEASYRKEYLQLGFEISEARSMARTRMSKETQAAYKDYQTSMAALEAEMNSLRLGR